MMESKRVLMTFCLLFAAWGALIPAQGQTPSDAIMMPARNACLLANYNYGQFDQYWEGDRLRGNLTIATVKRTTVLPMVAVGITDKLNLYAGVPYVKTLSTDPNGGKFAGAQGFQDLGLALKYEVLKKVTSKGELSVLGTVGYSTPITNYLPDYMPYSLGFGAPEVALRGIVQYKMAQGLYFRAALAHLWRGYAEAERDYYYNNGSYYTSWMDVPNAWSAEGILGAWLLDYSLRIELSYSNLKSTSGDDIRAYNAPQPTNRVVMGQAGLMAQYYLPPAKKLGVLVYHNQALTGLNAPKIKNFGAGITYQFKFL
ncbi:transporter [Salmonirosea aquatica]